MINDFAIAKQMIKKEDKVFTNSYFAPHLSHREKVIFRPPGGDIINALNNYNVILLNPMEPGWGSDTLIQQKVLKTAKLKSWECKLVGKTLNFCSKN